MENKYISRDIRQLNDNIHVMTSHSVFLLVSMLILTLSVIVWLFTGTVTDKAYLKGIVFPTNGTVDVCVPHSGIVRTTFVREGQKVNAGQHIAFISVGDSYSVITSSVTGTVLSFKDNNETFEAFEPVATLVDEKQQDAGRMLMAFSDMDNLKDLKPGQSVQVWPSNEDKDEIGFVRGIIRKVSRLPIEGGQISSLIKIPGYASEIGADKSVVYQVEVDLLEDAANPDQLDWTFKGYTHPDMGIGTMCDAIAITRTYSIFEYLFLKGEIRKNKVRYWLK